jgi:hypothetical protein
VIKILVLIAQKNVGIANNFIVQNVLLISIKQNVIFVTKIFVLIVYQMCFDVKNAKIIYAKIVLLNALNVILLFAKMKILVQKNVRIVKKSFVQNVQKINVFADYLFFVKNVFYQKKNYAHMNALNL